MERASNVNRIESNRIESNWIELNRIELNYCGRVKNEGKKPFWIKKRIKLSHAMFAENARTAKKSQLGSMIFFCGECMCSTSSFGKKNQQKSHGGISKNNFFFGKFKNTFKDHPKMTSASDIPPILERQLFPPPPLPLPPGWRHFWMAPHERVIQQYRFQQKMFKQEQLPYNYEKLFSNMRCTCLVHV